ncbi:transposase [Methanomethylovorans sp.]|uniref:transposase n=1 Tax=Methanomethylovorans sp. TaxID=2758717 RepID=UPI00351C0B12
MVAEGASVSLTLFLQAWVYILPVLFHLVRKTLSFYVYLNFFRQTYVKRGAIERFFAWLKMGFRKLATRYERLNIVFKGLLDIACFILCWKRSQVKF